MDTEISMRIAVGNLGWNFVDSPLLTTVTGYNNNTHTELDVGQEGQGAEDAVCVDSTAAGVELHSKIDATTGLPLDQPILSSLLRQAELESSDPILRPVELGSGDTTLPRSRVETQRPDGIFIDWNQRKDLLA